MKFISTEHVYEVKYLIANQTDYANYICEENEKTYIVSYVQNETLIKSLCGLFMNYRTMDNFDDLVDVFMYGEGLALVFLHYILVDTAQPQKLQDKLLFLEHFLSAVCVGSVPANIAYDVLKNKNAGTCVDGNFHFYYNLKELGNYEIMDTNSENKKFCQEFSRFSQNMLREELKKKPNKQLKDFFEKLARTSFEHILDLFDAYMDVCANYKISGEDGNSSVAKKEHSIEKTITKTIRIVKRIFIYLILFIAVGLLIYAVFFCSEDGGTGGKYEKIGDLQIEEFRKEE